MTETTKANPPDKAASEEATLNGRKRRKIRKGTVSCWECKRRKIRCTFSTPSNVICDGCRSRQKECVSQDFPDETPRQGRMVDRLGRMETMFEQLVQRKDPKSTDTLGQHKKVADATGGKQNTSKDHPSPASAGPAVAPITKLLNDEEAQISGDLGRISDALLSLWPNEDDLDLILSVPVGLSVLYHGIVFLPYTEFFSSQLPSPRQMLQLPPQGSHPVLIARRLLLLGTLLQGIPSSHAKKLASLSTPYKSLSVLLVNSVSRLVTSNDDLVGSLDGIECIMMESMYLNNQGNLRRAWLKNRRAMVMAQMMGLHKGKKTSIAVLEAETRQRINPDQMWFRLVVSDRYLSLTLGLPQGSMENSFSTPEVLEGCDDMEKMERLFSVITDLVLRRNEADRTSFEATHKLDKMLQEAAALMPPRWWLIPSGPVIGPGNDIEAFQEALRMTLLFTHYHLLVQLHLPYMLQPSSSHPGYDYSKLSCASAARSLLALFVTFLSTDLSTAYCRGIDFLAFISSTTLCLAHIESRRPSKGVGTSAFQSLRHQRLGDRALLERALEIMESMAQKENDLVAQRVASILRPLLAIEHDSAMGGHYHASASPDVGEPGSHWLSGRGEVFGELSIQIPYFGIIKIEHRSDVGDAAAPAPGPAPVDPTVRSSPTLDNGPGLVVLHEPSSRPPGKPLDQDSPGRAAPSARRSGYEISTVHPVHPDWQTVPSYFEELESVSSVQQNGLAGWGGLSPTSLESYVTQGVHLLVPGLSTDVEDWALQGVDTALFSSLTQG